MTNNYLYGYIYLTLEYIFFSLCYCIYKSSENDLVILFSRAQVSYITTENKYSTNLSLNSKLKSSFTDMVHLTLVSLNSCFRINKVVGSLRVYYLFEAPCQKN